MPKNAFTAVKSNVVILFLCERTVTVGWGVGLSVLEKMLTVCESPLVVRKRNCDIGHMVQSTDHVPLANSLNSGLLGVVGVVCVTKEL